MGEYIIYYHGVVVGGIYDNRFLVKPTDSVLKFLPDVQMEIPYRGGRPMIMISDIENRELLAQVLDKTYSALTEK